MVFDADRVSRVFIGLIAVVALVIAGLIMPRLLIPDVRSGVELESPEAQRYVEGRIGTTGGVGQRALRMQISIIDSRPDPRDCDWGYGEPVGQIITARVYTFWGIPVETIELSCDNMQRVAGPLSW